MMLSTIDLAIRSMLTALYSAPDRRYHSLNHIHECLGHLKSWPQPLSLSTATMAEEIIWWHDAVYNIFSPPGRNEIESETLYSFTMRRPHNDKINPSAVEKEHQRAMFSYRRTVSDGILATAKHLEDQVNLELSIQIVLDIDLAGLAGDRAAYARNGLLIAEEYEPLILAKGIGPYLKGRQAFLEAMLRRKQIYYIRTEWEEQARQNIGEEIQSLAAIRASEDFKYERERLSSYKNYLENAILVNCKKT